MEKRNDQSNIVGRFAPSPTGVLHTGSLVAAVGSYLLAKRNGGRWLLRLDDLDTQRLAPGMADDIMRTLESFGLFWDGEVSWQSRHLADYLSAFESLRQTGLIYPCGCSRKEIASSASAPHGDDDCIRYSGTCRDKMKSGAQVRSWRVRVSDEEICFDDLRKGRICQTLSTFSGDFALRRGDGGFAYQLAVVVDDYITGVNQVVRGEDLLASTPRQIYLQRLLGFPQPDYCHLPLVCEPGGAKLSKRNHPVSCQTETPPDTKRALLLDALHFLGQNPPPELYAEPCHGILDWGIANFKLQFAVLMFALTLPFLLPTESRADFFKYRDSSGNLVITNRLEDVPKKYRNRVKVVWDKDLEAKDPIASRSSAAKAQFEKQENAKKGEKNSETNHHPKGKTLVIELDENTGQLIRRFE